MLEEKLDTLTSEIVKLRQAIEKSGTGKAAASDDGEDKPKTTRKRAPAKKKEPETEHDQDEVGTIFRKAAKEDLKACKAYLKKRKCDDLADLLTKPEEYDAAYEFADNILNPPEDEDGDDGDDGDDDDI